MYAFLITARHADLEYRMATLDDLDAELELTALCFGRKRAEATRENRRRFLEKNPQMFWHLYSFNQLVAAINIVPLTHDAILEFRDGKRGWLFSNEQIEQFEPGHRLECIIIDMMRTPRVPQGDKNGFGMYLLLDLIRKQCLDGAGVALISKASMPAQVHQMGQGCQKAQELSILELRTGAICGISISMHLTCPYFIPTKMS